MHLPTLNEISPLLLSYGYLMFFVLSILEGPIITVIAGSLVALGYFNFWAVFAIAVVGDLIGDFLYYGVGRWGGTCLAARKRFLGINMEHVKKIEAHFADHAGKTLTFGKLTHAFGGAILVAAGMVKMPLQRFFWLNLFGTIPKSFVFLVIGFYFGQAYQQIDTYFSEALFAFVFAVFLLVGGYFVMHYIRKKMAID